MNTRHCLTIHLLLFVAIIGIGVPNTSRATLDLSVVPGKVITYIPSPNVYDFLLNGAGVLTSDPEITVLSNGWYLITHTTFHGDAVPGDVYMFRSTDKGATWTSLPLLHNLSSGGSFFYNGGVLYLMGGSYIIQSTDNGTTWTTPVDTTSGVISSPNSTWTPNNPVELDNRVWSAANTRIQSAPTVSNLLAMASWKWSGALSVTTNWLGGQVTPSTVITEAQIVASPAQGVVLMPKIGDLPNSVLIHGFSDTNTVGVLGTSSVDLQNNFVALPGGEKKFGATYDPVSGKFYVLSNPVLPAHVGYTWWWNSTYSSALIRNTAAVLTSRDLFNWKVEKIFLYSANIEHNAFQYFNFDFDGTNMVIASRTAYDVGDVNPPPRGHDSNLITFHRIDDFRNIAPNHYLAISGNQILRYERTPDPKDDDAPLGSFTLGSTFAGAALNTPNGIGTSGSDVYLREAGGRILHFDAAGNFIETTNASPVSFQTGQVTVGQPANGECSWAKSGSGDWFEPLNWYYWGRPDTTEEIALFGSAATAAATVNIPSATQTWNFNTDGDKEGWLVANASNAVVSAGLLQGAANNTVNTLQIYRNDRYFYGSSVPEVRIRMRSDANCDVYFYWTIPQDETFKSARRITLSYTGNGAFQELVFPMAGNPEWDGKLITRIRFDPRVHLNGGAREFAVDSITLPKESYRVKGLRFRNASPYTLSGGGQLRIEANSGSGTVEVLQGAHVNNVALILGSDTDVNLVTNTSLHLKQGIDLNGKTLHVNGLGRILMQGALAMNGGTLSVDGITPLTFTNNSTGAVLDGTLQFLPPGTFAPVAGNSFVLLKNPGVLGSKTFAQVDLPTLSAALQWNTNALYSTGMVSVEAAPNRWAEDVDGSWTDATKWTQGVAPGISSGANSTDEAIFDVTLAATRTVTVDANRNIGGITFGNSSANLYTLTGGSLRLSDGGVVQTVVGTGTHNDEIASAITVMGNGASAFFRNNAIGNGAGLKIGTIAGSSTAGSTTTITFDGVSTTVSLSGKNNTSGVISDGAGGGKVAVVKNGSGIWTMSVFSTYSGGLTFNEGTIRYFGSGIHGFGTGTVTINGDVAFYRGNTAANTMTNPLLLNGNMEVKNGGNTTWSGAVDCNGSPRTITTTTDLSLTGNISNGGLIKAGGSVLTLSGANTYALGTTISAGTLIGTENGALGSGPVTVVGGATLTLGAINCLGDQAALTLDGTSTLNLNFTGTDTVGAISLDGGSTWLTSGTYTAASLGASGTGSLVIGGFASDPANTPYWWLEQYGLTNYEADAMADTDGDGLLSWQEYVAGTDPTNPASVFKITGNVATPQGEVIRWSSVSNRFYDLGWTTNLLEAFVVPSGATNLPATPPENTYTNPLDNGASSFYRVNVYR
ncbi:MAG: autotransporter-associated beta strand repeat-containing protein [Kiritimatiellales bacterium]|nr:autotransporter-associated beta strand repeat-containing protein [Kiritimatiellales bacterium]MCF7864558.1 autotransporter-associated beta strand repeat-containing protein [Kiritimatiellales bacterium]